MRTAFTRGLAAILATWMVVGCSPQPPAFPAKTAEEIKQLTDVTDRVVLLVREPERATATRAAIAALRVANRQYQLHSDAIVNKKNIDAIACTSAQAIEIADLETLVARRDDAAGRLDQVAASRRSAMLTRLAMDAFRCAVISNRQLIDHEQRREALKHGAVVISQIYSIAAILRAATDLPLAPLLEDQIHTYETIAAKLGPEHEPQVVTDALPKLKGTLASLRP